MERKRPFLLSSRESPKSKMMKIDESATSRSSTVDLAIPITRFNSDKSLLKSIKISGDIDLTYPFWNDREDQTLNPPIVNPPLFDNNGHLDIKLISPLYVKNKGLAIRFVGPIKSDIDNNLTLGIDNQCPLIVENGNLSLKIGDGVKVENNSLTLDVSNNDFDFSNQTLNIKTLTPIISTPLGIKLHFNENIFRIVNEKLDLNVVSPLINSVNGIKIQLDTNVFENSNALSIKTISPLNIGNNGIFINVDNQSIESGSNLSIKLNQISGIEKHTDGIRIKLSNNSGLSLSVDGLSCNLGKGLEVTSANDISVKYQSPLYIDSNGIGLLTGNGLEITSTSIQTKIGAGLMYNDDGSLQFGYQIGRGLELFTDNSNTYLRLKLGEAITFDDNGGIKLEYLIGIGLEINNASDGKYLRIKAGTGLTFGSDRSIRFRYSFGNGLETSGDTLQIKVQSNGGLSRNSDGIGINCVSPLNINSNSLQLLYDDTSFKVEQGKLMLVNNPTSTYNFVYAEYGSESFGTLIPVFGGKTTNSCKMRPFITLSWMGSTVTGIFRAKIINGECPNMLSSDPIKFGIILDAKSDTQLGQSPKVTAMYPDSPNTIDKVTPSNHYIQYSRTYDELMSNRPTFFDSSDLKWVTISNFIPGKVGSFGNLSESKLYLSTLTYKDRVVLYFVIDISGGNTFFDTSSDSNKQILIIDVPFFYSGLKANVSP